MLADSGASDDGDDITADMRIAFNGLGAPDVIKQFVMARPFLTSDGEVTPAIAINVDYRTDAELAAVTSVIMSQAEWDIAEWDVAEWPLEERVIAEWNSIAAEIGNVASFRMEVSALGGGGGDITLRLNAVQILYIPTEGGYI